ncbi:2-hydroxychromene-2-carboxylate isomerase [Neptunomonas qingdaonensis]|uniref:2-hydroxychromene-2-carboxylate isomerase n=1 Tax=Neptunomonas qingdaonensis TaxID=1045558 RepID=A0A1I2Q8Y3_9GAMM|nr:2-hydroxychromene-2-carboxylate isomerase [Neptunomonas qingdaonensis]SFG24778.1 2-hydroxychromene-2-carboxylate isomerase [Neptunomonas qingdaonensis]
MTKKIEYYFVLNSPWSYFSGARLGQIAKQKNADIDLKPVLLSELFPRTGGQPLKQRSQQRQAYRLAELKRWSSRLALPIHLEPTYFPVDESLAVRTVIAAIQSQHDALELVIALGAALWRDNLNLADEQVIADVLIKLQLPLTLIQTAKDEQSYAKILSDNTEEAISKGVFGVPTFVVGSDVFWGQDRLDFVEQALT